jgi:ribosomal protein L30E
VKGEKEIKKVIRSGNLVIGKAREIKTIGYRRNSSPT